MYTELPFQLGIAALPFLPRGKGATILILGGILVLGLAFLLTLFSPGRANGSRASRSAHNGAATALAVPIVVRGPSAALNDKRLGWSGPLIRGVAHAGVQGMTILAVEPERVVVRLDRCRTCERQSSRRLQCEPERRLFVRMGRATGQHVEVAELLCRQQGQGTCVFEIDRGSAR